MNSNLLLAFYGDDFTGSTDALEFLCRAGAKTMLFIEPPTPEQLKEYPGLQAIGVAGKTRSMTPEAMEEILQPAFEQLKLLSPRHVHYKVCSTFDSSPTTGSIGKAIETGLKVFQQPIVPLLVAAPSLGRYCLFGNLFARMGIGSDGNIFRLDRHPSMSKHPVTPADESDLRLHLAKQTSLTVELLDIFQVDKPIEEQKKIVEEFIQERAAVLLIDALYESQLLSIGELIDGYARESSLYSVGSSGIEMALGKYWNANGCLSSPANWEEPGEASPLLVISGSCSPVTAAQIEWAKANGFEDLTVDITKPIHHQEIQATIARLMAYIQQGRSVILHTGEKQLQQLSSEMAGTILGTIAREAVMSSGLKRLVIAGGDTSSYAARALEITAVEMIAPFVPGAPLCKAFSPNKAINGLEVNFKGGQVGAANYFGVMKEGKLI